MGQQLEGRVAVVTGASRGIGKGIAVELGANGATVYVTGRTTADGGILPGTVGQTAKEIDELGGQGIAAGVRPPRRRRRGQGFRAGARRAGTPRHPRQQRLLLSRSGALVGEASSGSCRSKPGISASILACVPIIVAAAFGAPLMLETGPGLIANISSPGAVAYSHNVPYGVGKAAVDRLSHDMAVELRPHGIGVVSLWPGIVATEMVALGVPRNAEGRQILTLPGEGDFDLADADSPRFAGRAVAALFGAPDILERSGKAFHVADLAEAYGFTDIDGRIPRTLMPGRAKQRQ